MEEIKNLLLEQFNGPVTITMIVTSLLVAFAISLFIILVYRKTFSGVVYNRTMTLCILLLSMVTAMIIRTINSNLSLSLGMVGALSIVRFRTAIKEPVDTAFMFWAITAGIMSGAGLYVIAIVGSLLLGLAYYLMYLTGSKAKSQYLLVVRYFQQADEAVQAALGSVKNRKLKSRTMNDQKIVEATYEIDYAKNTDTLMNELQAIEGVKNVNLVSYNSEFGL